MRRILAILALAGALGALLVSGVAAGGDEGTYEVRAIFDNAGFLVTGEDVRIAGANVGSVAEVDVTGPDEVATEDGEPAPGKAVAVLRIEDAGYQDFREDASCLIRPQSLIGEKFVECEATQPRAPGTEPPPELAQIPEGEPGEGQYLLPLERNGKTVDLDLVNNIMREPYPDRFRLIINDLGAGLAARGEELAEVVERSNPALRETNQTLAILARQNRRLVSLAEDSDAILSALARERESIAGFINESATTAEATAERRAELEETFARFPGFLRELRSTMTELRAFSDQATPVFDELGGAAPSLTRASRALEPFANAGTRSFTSLGDAADAAAEPLAASDPVIRQLRGLGRTGEPGLRNTAQLLSTMRKTGGFQGLLETIFGLGGTMNAFDGYGHFGRAVIPVNTCFDYTAISQPGCGARFTGPTGSTPPAPIGAGAARAQYARLLRRLTQPDRAHDDPSPQRDGRDARGERGPELGSAAAPEREPAPLPGREPPASEADQPAPEADAMGSLEDMRAARDLLDFLIGAKGKGGGQ